MKKKLLMGIIGLGALTLFTSSVKAETLDLENVSETGQTVTVGEVDVTVYSVDITWGDMTYDWKYDSSTNRYGFKQHLICEGYRATGDTLDELNQFETIYSDADCSVERTDGLDAGMTYYKTSPGGWISVVDNSVNGKVKAALKFVSSEDYNWVSGRFTKGGYFNVTGQYQYGEEITDGYLPMVSDRQFYGVLHLDVNDYNRVSTINTSDVIGTITVNIIPA